MRWATAVKEWNSVQFFKDDLYGIPKKGGIYYDDVKEIMAQSKHAKTVEKMMGKEEPPKEKPAEPEIKSIPRVEEEPKMEAPSESREMTTETNVQEIINILEDSRKLPNKKFGDDTIAKQYTEIYSRFTKSVLGKLTKSLDETNNLVDQLLKEKASLKRSNQKNLQTTKDRIKRIEDVDLPAARTKQKTLLAEVGGKKMADQLLFIFYQLKSGSNTIPKQEFESKVEVTEEAVPKRVFAQTKEERDMIRKKLIDVGLMKAKESFNISVDEFKKKMKQVSDDLNNPTLRVRIVYADDTKGTNSIVSLDGMQDVNTILKRMEKVSSVSTFMRTSVLELTYIRKK